MKQGIVLFGHGSRNPDWAAPFEAIRDEIERQQAGTEVELAFLELMAPTLPEAVGRLAARGVGQISVIPVFISTGSHVREDLPRLVAQALTTHPALDIRVAAPLGEAPEMLRAMAQYALVPVSREA
jgi:sirohydrochlorin cobaltochelatase